MELEHFKKLVNDPMRSKEGIEKMMNRALAEEKSDFANTAKDALDYWFPGWNNTRLKRGGAKPTLARFQSNERVFPSEWEAYIWLICRFIDTYPGPFVTYNWETKLITSGRSRLYFTKDLAKMFPESPHLADNSNNYTLLPNGWYANIDLDNKKKIEILHIIGLVAKLRWDVDWFYQVLP